MLTLLAALALDADFTAGGPRLASIGDVDGDGISELAVAFPEGLEVFSGASGCTLRSWRLDGKYGARQVWTVAPAGDVDGDGRADVAVSILQSKESLPPRARRYFDYAVRGRVEVYSVHDGICLRGIPEEGLLSGGFGYAIDGGSDFDGDGAPDLVVASPANLERAVSVFSGATGDSLTSWSRKMIRDLARGVVDPGGRQLGTDDSTGPFSVTFNEPSEGAGADVVFTARGAVLALGRGGRTRVSSTPTFLIDPRPIDDLTADGVPELAGGYTIVDGRSLEEMVVNSHMATYPWSSQAMWMTTAAPLGDVDGDGAFEHVVGHVDTFGSNSGWVASYTSSSREATWAETVIQALHAGMPTAWPGYVVAGLEDVDGDDARDFAALALGTRKLVVRSGRRPSRVLWSLELE